MNKMSKERDTLIDLDIEELMAIAEEKDISQLPPQATKEELIDLILKPGEKKLKRIQNY